MESLVAWLAEALGKDFPRLQGFIQPATVNLLVCIVAAGVLRALAWLSSGAEFKVIVHDSATVVAATGALVTVNLAAEAMFVPHIPKAFIEFAHEGLFVLFLLAIGARAAKALVRGRENSPGATRKGGK